MAKRKTLNGTELAQRTLAAAAALPEAEQLAFWQLIEGKILAESGWHIVNTCESHHPIRQLLRTFQVTSLEMMKYRHGKTPEEHAADRDFIDAARTMMETRNGKTKEAVYADLGRMFGTTASAAKKRCFRLK